jgi:uncharacterized RDD family membrane protein YckC
MLALPESRRPDAADHPLGGEPGPGKRSRTRSVDPFAPRAPGERPTGAARGGAGPGRCGACGTWFAARPSGWMSSSPAGLGGFAAAPTPAPRARPTRRRLGQHHDCACGRRLAAAAPGHHPGKHATEVLRFRVAFTAFAFDMGVTLGVFLLAHAAISFAARVLTARDITWNRNDIWVIVTYAAWAFIYFVYSWAASGRTAGMALFGVRVVRDDGTDASGRQAIVRALALPLSFLLLGLGFAGILLAAGAAHCMTSSPGPRSSTRGTHGHPPAVSVPGLIHQVAREAHAWREIPSASAQSRSRSRPGSRHGWPPRCLRPACRCLSPLQLCQPAWARW